MFENALEKSNVAYAAKIKYKTLVSVGLVALAIVLPQVVHIVLGQPGGIKWLPMYFPILIGGCLLGAKWGLMVGVLSPIVSFAITSTLGNAMPAAARLPFMVIELAVFALVSGLFSGKISKNGLWAFPAVILAQISGRAVFFGLVTLTQSMTSFTPEMIRQQIQTGLIGLAVQAVLVPVIIIELRNLNPQISIIKY